MSIASRITSMEQHIGNAYDKLDELGVNLTNVDKNLNNIAELLDGVYEDYPKTTTTNVTEPSIGNTKAGKMEIDLKGNTEQFTTTGKNLFKPISSGEKYGITFTNNGDGSYKINGTATQNTSFYITGLSYSSGTYTLSANNTQTSSGIVIQIETTNDGLKNFNISSVNAYVSFTVNDIIAESIIINNGTTVNNLIIKPQLETGSSATSYEPYTNGASPNPDYPQDVEVVSGENIVKVVNKNLFDKNNVNIYNGYADYNIWVSNANHRTIYIPCKPNTTYTVTKTNEGSNVRFAVITCPTIPETGTKATDTLKDNSATHITKITGPDDYYLAVWCYVINDTDVTWQEVIDSIQIEQGSTATTYEEHKEQDFPISLSSKNLFDKDNITEPRTLLEYTNNNWQVITNNPYFNTTQIDNILPNTSYTVSFVSTGIGWGFRIVEYDKNNNIITGIKNTTNNVLNFTTQANTLYVKLCFNKDVNSNIMLEKGSTATTYQSFYDYELCKIGDYHDYPWKDESTGKWYIHKGFQKIVFDNDSKILTGSSSTDGYARVGYGSETDIGWKSNSILGVYCNKFKGVIQNENTPSITGQHWYISNTSVNGFIILFRSGDLSLNGSQLATLIKTSGVYIYCFRKTPTDIEITDTTLINQLEAIYNTAKSYDDTTNIIQENNDLPFILDITTLKKS